MFGVFFSVNYFYLTGLHEIIWCKENTTNLSSSSFLLLLSLSTHFKLKISPQDGIMWQDFQNHRATFISKGKSILHVFVFCIFCDKWLQPKYLPESQIDDLIVLVYRMLSELKSDVGWLCFIQCTNKRIHFCFLISKIPQTVLRYPHLITTCLLSVVSPSLFSPNGVRTS